MRLRHFILIAILGLLPSFARAQGGQVTLIRSSVEPLPNCTPAAPGRLEPQIWDITAGQVKYCTAPNTWTGASTPTLFYQTVAVGGVNVTQEPRLNFINGSGMTISCVDNAVSTRSDCTFTSSVTAATAFSALTAAVNNSAGTFAFSGNTFDLTNAAAFNLPKVGVGVPGSTSGTSTLSPPTTGSFTWALPAGSGTFAVSALSPIVITPAGQIQCPTCSVSGGSVTSVGLSQTGSIFTISGSPVTSAGSINLAFASEPANTVFAGPSSAPGTPLFRALVGADIPAINLGASGAGGVTGLLGKANNLATAVYTDQANTFTAGIQSFAAAAGLGLPTATPTLAGQLSYDSVNARLIANLNGTNFIIPWIPIGTPVTTQCAVYTGTGGQLGSSTCGTGGGGSTGTINNASQFSFPYYSTVGSTNVLSGIAPPTTNGVYQLIYNITGGLASAPQISLPGVSVRANTGTTDTILQSDRVSLVTESNVAAVAVTGPTLTGNIPFALYNRGAGLVTYTPASGQVNGAASQILPGNSFAFHYTDGLSAFMPVMPTLASFPNATSTPLFFTAATGAFSTGILGVTGGGTGLSTETSHALWIGQGTGSPTFLGPLADAIPLWQSSSLDPTAFVLPSCSGTTNALTYNTSSHTVGCNVISGGGGGSGGQINYPVSYPQRNVSIGASLTAANTLSNSNTATTIFGSYTGRASSPAESMLPFTDGTKTVRIKSVGVVSTGATNFALTLTVSLGGVTLGTITMPTIANLSSAGWDLEFRYTVTGLTTAQAGGCAEIIGTSSAALKACSSGAITGLNFATTQLVDVKAAWTTASASNIFTTNQANIAVEQSN